MQKELWVKVNGYENYYVSNLGNIKNVDTNKELKKCFSSNGYYIVQLYKDKKPKCQRVHQLVFESFTKIKSNNFYVIDHIDNNKLNNNLDNLQIISHRENLSKDKKECSSKYTGVYLHKPTNKWISHIRINGIKKHIGYFENELDASNAYQEVLLKITKNK